MDNKTDLRNSRKRGCNILGFEENEKKIDFSYQSKQKMIFQQVEWPSAKLRRTILDGSDFTEANLSHADLTSASLRDAIFTKASLDGACLRNVDARRAKFGLANLQGADVYGADLRGIRGKYAVWRGVNWWEAKLSDSLRTSLEKRWSKEEAIRWRKKHIISSSLDDVLEDD